MAAICHLWVNLSSRSAYLVQWQPWGRLLFLLSCWFFYTASCVLCVRPFPITVTTSLTDGSFLMEKTSLESLCGWWSMVPKLVSAAVSTKGGLDGSQICHRQAASVNTELKSHFKSFLNLWHKKTWWRSYAQIFSLLPKEESKLRSYVLGKRVWQHDNGTWKILPREGCGSGGSWDVWGTPAMCSCLGFSLGGRK